MVGSGGEGVKKRGYHGGTKDTIDYGSSHGQIMVVSTLGISAVFMRAFFCGVKGCV